MTSSNTNTTANDEGSNNTASARWSSIGAKVLAAGAFVSAKAKEIDEKHKIVDKTKNACSAVATKAKEVDEKHHITEKTKAVCTTAAVKTKEGIDNISKSITK
eukprot:CAMPEP_0172415134 /NCGR_PEP_ID=MMETSP1064-20121228/1640_1 /TAXON_ID=202472 /ORGANISM="Aulacoseira subarctica , Strain CCAP 1002/5" /LENGTH=102 /DNA_ID=CAMNT_0013152037 /DNA_START=71 /DNA_END=379 /DNA_ORIENTATION=+